MIPIQCDSCDRLIPQKDGKFFEGNRFICNQCIRTEVNKDRAEVVIRDVIRLLNSVGFEDIIYDNFDYKIINKLEMNKLIDRKNVVGLHSVDSYNIDEHGISEVKETIYILDHLTEIVFRATVAHEIIHSWQTRNYLHERFSKDEESQKKVEGFAQMGSYLVYYDLLRHKQSQFVMQRLNATLEWDDPYYGRAFKKIYKQFQEFPGNALQKWYYIIRCARKNELHVD